MLVQKSDIEDPWSSSVLAQGSHTVTRQVNPGSTVVYQLFCAIPGGESFFLFVETPLLQ